MPLDLEEVNLDLSPSSLRHFTDPQRVIVNLPKSHLINCFLKRDHPLPVEQNLGPCVWAGSARAPKCTHFPGLPPPHGPGHPGQRPLGEEFQLHHESWRIQAPTMLVSVLTVGLVWWLKEKFWYPGIGRGWRRGCGGQTKGRKTSLTQEVLGQNPPVTQCCHLGTQCWQPPCYGWACWRSAADPSGWLMLSVVP